MTDTAIIATLPAFSGDGYGYGGGTVVTFTMAGFSRAIQFGEDQNSRYLAETVAHRWNAHDEVIRLREASAVMDRMAEALRLALVEAERIGIDDLADGFPADVCEQMRGALIAAGYEVK